MLRYIRLGLPLWLLWGAGPALAQDKPEGGDPGPMLPPPNAGLIPPALGRPDADVPPPPPLGAQPVEPQAAAPQAPTPVTPNGGEGSINGKVVPCAPPNVRVAMDYVDAPVMDIVKYMAEITCRNFILSEELRGQVTIISHQQVTASEAYEAFLSALEVVGYTTVQVGKNTKVVTTDKAGSAPLRIYEDGDIPATDNFVTQIIQLENVSVSDISSVVKELSGPQARIIPYQTSNTMIITDAAYNIRRVYRVIKQLDVAAPKSRVEIIPIVHATASDVEKVIEELYGTAATSSSSASSSAATSAADRAAARRRGRDGASAGGATTAAAGASVTSAGSESAFISKIIADERTNSLIVLANDEALIKIKEVVASLDVDIDPASRSQIHVLYLDHAKAEDIASVISDLANSSGASSSGRSGGASSGSNSSNRRNTGSTNNFPAGGNRPAGPSTGGRPSIPGGAGGDGTTIASALENIKVTPDENTNSLVVLASPEDFRLLKTVIDKLDIPRRQVFVEAVVLEVGSEDKSNLGIGYHVGAPGPNGGVSYYSAQMGANSLQVDTASLLSGLAMGVLGQSITIPITDPTTGASVELAVPAFGVAVHALASNSQVNILSDPSLLVVDNEEATINVGKNVPFKTSDSYSGFSSQAFSQYTREDVGITLKVSPQINESNYVTMEVSLEVAEVEEGSGDTGLLTTTKREVENVVVVRDNQTVVIGGLIGTTKTEARTKIPILGDIPLIGVLFRGRSQIERKTNLLIFLTPHVINEPADLEEVYRVKWAQREEFLRRFYGQTPEHQEDELRALLGGSMNVVDEPSAYRTKATPVTSGTLDETPAAGAAKESVVTPVTPPEDQGGR